MKSNKQRRQEIRQARERRKARKARSLEPTMSPVAPRGTFPVNCANLAPYNSYGDPLFVRRGCYEDKPFTCQDCGAEEIWTAEQQKWWYEDCKGYVYSTAIRCRACRLNKRIRDGRAQPASEQMRVTA